MKNGLIAALLCAAGVALTVPGLASAGVMSGAAAETNTNTSAVELVGRRDHRGSHHKRKLIDIHIGKKRHGNHGRRHGKHNRH